jgi:DNA-binding XRE family transcriptional regulator
MDIEKVTRDYVLHDKTFREIGEELGVTKQAVHAFWKRNQDKANEIKLKFDCSSGFTSEMKFKRKTLGITQEQLAKKIGTFKSNISVIESGKIKRSKYIDLICAELQISC